MHWEKTRITDDKLDEATLYILWSGFIFPQAAIGYGISEACYGFGPHNSLENRTPFVYAATLPETRTIPKYIP